MHCFLQEAKIKHHLTPMEAMCSLLAAVSHDLDHPGVNQNFLVATKSHLAALYNVCQVFIDSIDFNCWLLIILHRIIRYSRVITGDLHCPASPNHTSLTISVWNNGRRSSFYWDTWFWPPTLADRESICNNFASTMNSTVASAWKRRNINISYCRLHSSAPIWVIPAVHGISARNGANRFAMNSTDRATLSGN